jgi:hypothetical protein
MRWSPNRVVAAIVAGVVVVAAVVVGVTWGRTVTTYDLALPEGVAQAYLRAAFDGLFDEAASYFAPDSDCDASDLDRAFIQEEVRISLIDVSIDGDRSTVRIAADFPGGDPFGGSYEERHTLRLVQVEGMWKLTGIPWPLYDCNPPKT